MLVYGLRVGGIPLWRLLVHDWSKFRPSEARIFMKNIIYKNCTEEEWQFVRLLHTNRNKHHWEYWILKGKPIPIPETYVREMVADWMAAGKSYSGIDSIQSWIDKKSNKLILHPKTIHVLEQVLKEQNINWPSSEN